MTHPRPIPMSVMVLLLSLTYLIAYLIRYRYFIGLGGLSDDYLIWAHEFYFGGITPSFVNNAKEILALDWGASPKSYPPTYPLLLAGLMLIGGDDLQIVRLLQIGIDSLGVLLVYFISRRLGCCPLVSVLAALGYAVAPWWAWGSTPLLADAIIPLLVLLLVLQALRARARDSIIGWVVLGMAAAVLSLARSEFGLLFIAIALLAAIGSQQGKLRSLAASQTGFWLPWLGIALLNYASFGNFFPANNATFYALYSGLGQITNDFGYVVSDEKAIERLAEHGIQYHSREAEAFFRNIYFNAWLEHPGHVLRTILYRFKLIAFHQEAPTFSGTSVTLFRWGMVMAIACAGLLLYKRRFYDAIVVAGPLLFALFTIGIIYVELRYVRYASLTYLISAAVVVSAISSMAGTRVTRTPTVAASFVLAYCALAIAGLLPADTEARKAVFDASEEDFADLPMSPVQGIEPEQGARVDIESSEIKIFSSPTIMGSQAWAVIDTQDAARLLVDISASANMGGDWSFRILSENQWHFHSQTEIKAGQELARRYSVNLAGDRQVWAIFTSYAPGAMLSVHALRVARSCGNRPLSLSWLVFPSSTNIPPFNSVACPNLSASRTKP